MLQDSVRTSAYYEAILGNADDFRDKVVLDVGAGSGILSWFCLQAGARHVYCVEAAASMHDVLRRVARANGWQARVTVLAGRVEDFGRAHVPHAVDCIVSEPMGVLLLHERMLESYLYARDAFLAPGAAVRPGQLYPAAGALHFGPFSDDKLYREVQGKAHFWTQADFYGVDVSSLADMARDHYTAQPVIDTFSPHQLMACAPVTHPLDFATLPVAALGAFAVPLAWRMAYTGIVHGVAAWFDVRFAGARTASCLSTAPHAPKTHWYQIRFLLPQPLAINAGQPLTGDMVWRANAHRSYDIALTLVLDTLRVVQHYKLNEQQYLFFAQHGHADAQPLSPETFGLYAPPDVRQ